MTGFAGGGASAASDTITGTLTPGYIPVATGAHTLGDSVMIESGSLITTAGSHFIDGAANTTQLKVQGNVTQTAALVSFERSTSVPAFQLFASSGFQGSSWEGMEHTGTTYTMAMLNDWTGAELAGLGIGANGLVLSSAYQVSWGDTANDIFGNVTDTGLARSSAGIVSFTGGSASSKGGFLSQKGSSIVGSANEVQLTITANATQSADILRIVTNNSVNTFMSVSNVPTLYFQTNAGGATMQLVGTGDGANLPSVRLASDGTLAFNSTTNLNTGALDTGLQRSSAGIVKFTAGASGNGGFLSQLGSSIVGHADEVQFLIKGHSTQTANFFNISSSTGSNGFTCIANANSPSEFNFGNTVRFGDFPCPTGNSSAKIVIFTGAPSNINLGSTTGIVWWSDAGGAITGASDVGLARLAAGVLQVTNGTTVTGGSGSLVIGPSTASIGTSGVGVLAIGTGTAPSSSPPDEFQIYSADQNSVAGNAAMHVRTEVGSFVSVISSAGNFYKRWTQVNTSGTVTVTVAQSGTVFANTGASGLVTYNLPAAAAGLTYAFCVLDADGASVVANGTDVIYLGSSATSAGGNVQSTTIGSAILLVAVGATNWVALGVTGLWATA